MTDTRSTDDRAGRLDPSEAFAELGRIVLGQQSLEDILGVVVNLAQRVMPMPVEASITLMAGDDATTAAFTGDLAMSMDERQYDDAAGPCLAAATGNQVVSVPDVSEESRWPGYAKAAEAAGVGSSLSIPLPVQRQVTGALNFYAFEADAFDADSGALAASFASYAAVAVANAHLYESTSRLADQMVQAMESRAVIEQAKGILMRDRGCTSAEAFDALVELSQQSHRKLREIAQLLVDQVADQPDKG
jgi:GAF domain-containing protein